MTEMKSVAPTGVGRMKSKAISIGGYASVLEKIKRKLEMLKMERGKPISSEWFS